jgi:hypothetical protein
MLLLTAGLTLPVAGTVTDGAAAFKSSTSSTAPLQSNSDYRQVPLLGYAGVGMRNVRFWPWLCENAAAETVRRIGLLQSVFSAPLEECR